MNKFEAGRYAASFMPPVLRLTRTVSGMPFNDGMYLLADHLKTELKELPAIANELYTLASRPTGSCGSTMNPVMNSDLRQAVTSRVNDTGPPPAGHGAPLIRTRQSPPTINHQLQPYQPLSPPS